MRKVVTTRVQPPIPDRRHDWCAYFDGEEEAGGYGYGSTEDEAIDDLLADAICDGRITSKEAQEISDAIGAERFEDQMIGAVPQWPVSSRREAALAIAATNLDATLLETVASALDIPADPARVAVEGEAA